MSSPLDHATEPRSGSPAGRWDRDSPAFARVTALSDGVFAIAMTLLVFTLQMPDVPDRELAPALLEQAPQLLTTVLSFALVANLWWQHHQFFDRLVAVDPTVVALNLALLGAVALVPFPTSLIGQAPTAQAAVLPFIGLFVGLSALYLVLLLRARSTGVLDQSIDPGQFTWLAARWASGIVVMLLAMVVSLWLPAVGLGILGITVALGPLSARASRSRLRALADRDGLHHRRPPDR